MIYPIETPFLHTRLYGNVIFALRIVMQKLFNTRITELFGIRLPVLAGGLQWLADAKYVAAAAHAGILGFITAGSFVDDKDLRLEIRKCRDFCAGRPFGVNISMLPKIASDDRVNAIVDIVAEERVAFVETSGRSPEAYLPRLQGAGAVVMHKVPAIKYALKAQEIGVDAVAIVGNECAGHPGPHAVGTFVQTVLAARRLRIPFVVGGGVGTGAHLVAALTLGADGVLIGTRFLVAEEITSHPGYKQRLVASDETQTATILSSLRNTMRVLHNETASRVQELERAGASAEQLLPLVSGQFAKQAY
jgi:NAD(P)H-dependent flavin oxidoreductase YrpB (nitropropane dioxygenase family)